MKLTGLISATYTPFVPGTGKLNLDLIAPMTDFMLSRGSSGFYVCGSTGEGESLSIEERKLVAEAYVVATRGRVPVVIQVGHNSITSAKELAAHAAEIGADAISTLPPTYFKPGTVESLIDYIAQITDEAPNLPYYFYHIPRMSGVHFDMINLLKLASERLPSFTGVKFSDFNLAEMIACQGFENGRYDIPFGSDEMMLGALACGAKGAVGSCYGFAGPLWLKIIAAHESGAREEATLWMRKAEQLVRMIGSMPGPFQACVKQVIWPLHGLEVGPLRAPQPTMSEPQVAEARRWLETTGLAEELITGEFKLP